MIKAVFFDIDGTLLSLKDNSFPDSARFALTQLKKKGIKIFIATGRHLSEMKSLAIMELPFDGYVLLNGQLCLDANKKVLCSYPIFQEDKHILVELYEKKDIPIIFVEQESLYINMSNEIVEAAQRTIALPIPPIAAYSGNPIYQATAFVNKTECEQIMKHLPHCKMMRWNDVGVDIISNQGGKAIGMAQVLKHYHLQRDEIMAFGDNENDMDMLAFAGLGIAMGNALDIEKKVSDDVTDTVDEDGIYHALQKYQLL